MNGLKPVDMSDYSYDYMSSFNIPCWNPRCYGNLPLPPKPDKIVISVCVSTWARSEQIIQTSVESVFNQSFPPENYEVILVDDATEGFRLDELLNAVKYLIREYPNHNFRAYFIKHSRSWNDTHTLNVAFKRALGWIIIQNQSDVIFLDNILESAWRHHNHQIKLRVFPHVMNLFNDGSLKPSWIGTGKNSDNPEHNPEPHELGASYPRKCVHKIKGRDERIKRVPPDEEFQWNMRALCGLIAVKDPSVRVANRQFKWPPEWNVKSLPRQLTPELQQQTRDRPFKTIWADNDNWGLLILEEEKLTQMTEAMKTNLSKQ